MQNKDTSKCAPQKKKKEIVLISEQNEDNDAFSYTFMFLSSVDPQLLRSVGVCETLILAL